LALSPPERHLLFEALAQLSLVRLAIWLLPFRRWQAFLCGPRPVRRAGLKACPTSDSRGAAPRPSSGEELSPEHIARAIAAAARVVPVSTCLVRALACHRVLARHGHPSRVHIGVAAAPAFRAHAWLECRGTTLVGGGAPLEYKPIATIGRA